MIFSLRDRGFSLIEVILAGALLVFLVTGLTAALFYGRESIALHGARTRAVFLAEEAVEAARNIAAIDWSRLQNGVYGLGVVNAAWVLGGTSDTTEGFTRQLRIGVMSSTTVIVTSTVTGPSSGTRGVAVELIGRFTRWARTIAGNWAAPTVQKTIDAAGTQDGVKIAVQGDYAYMVRSNGTPDFLIVHIANPAAPTVAGSLSLDGVPTNIAVSGNYAYVTNEDNNAELQIVNISNPATPSVTGSYNAAGTANARAVAVSHTIAYMLRNRSGNEEFLVINATNPAAPALISAIDLPDDANEIALGGSLAYIASSDNDEELQIINIATPASPAVAGIYDLAGAGNALSVAAITSTVFIGRTNGLFVLSATAPAVPTLLGFLDVGGGVNDIAVGNTDTLAFVATDVNTREFQVINIGVLKTPSVLGFFNATSTLRGAAYDVVRDRALTVGDANDAELSIFSPR